MNIDDDHVKKFFMSIGFTTANNWCRQALKDKIKELPSIVEGIKREADLIIDNYK